MKIQRVGLAIMGIPVVLLLGAGATVEAQQPSPAADRAYSERDTGNEADWGWLGLLGLVGLVGLRRREPVVRHHEARPAVERV
ncbi:MAG TPA: WGxxGxxG family protein [Thermoanaerobaculia bacterium]|nr:WGxxGxxG family protein [Thermoanaerobaculia bacterium]